MKKFSQEGIDFLIELEGLRFTPYRDSAGKYTIGIGHLIMPGEDNLIRAVLNREQAIELLYRDLRRTEQVVNAEVKVPVTQYQYDALVLFAYNIGVGAFAISTVLDRLNKGRYEEAEKHFDDWVKITKDGKKIVLKGLQNRRDEEQELFNHGDYKRQR